MNNNILSIKIKNFRGIDSLQISEFRRVNLFYGRNNSGKSSVLEAIFILCGMANPLVPELINKIRGLSGNAGSNLKYLFYNLSMAEMPNITATIGESEFGLSISPHYVSPNTVAQTDTNSIIPTISGVELRYYILNADNEKFSDKSSIDYYNNEIFPSYGERHKDGLNAFFLSDNNKEATVLAQFSEIVKKKKSKIVLNALQKIDPNIEDIQPLPDGLYFAYKGIDELIPCNLAGDGIRKVLNIITIIADMPDSIVLIDEIENGLHYSAHKQLWESILHIANEFNVQLFITSHSIDTLRSLNEIMENIKYENYQDDLSIYTLSHTANAGIKAYRYSAQGLNTAIETNTEIRQ